MSNPQDKYQESKDIADRMRREQEEYREKERRGSNGGCFTADTPILTTEGYQPISSIKVGNTVLSISARGALVEVAVERVGVYFGCTIHQVILNDPDNSFSVTSSHPVLTQNGWNRVGALSPGDVLTAVKNGRIKDNIVEKVEVTCRIEPVFNLTVGGDNTFVTGGCVAHSFVRFHSLRVTISKLRKLAGRNPFAEALPT